ncbi:hypothetical protein ACFQ36_08715 [Arthrobacter sp. GCM10027362]|uniref:hypothetical protein n=1 Tax=Arthrobacter sp. GCM10027362 TaxID=3273379 RepID=UPI003642B662
MKTPGFVSAVRASAGIDTNEHARAVTAALRETAGAEYWQVLDQLPEDWDDLLHTGDAQH